MPRAGAFGKSLAGRTDTSGIMTLAASGIMTLAAARAIWNGLGGVIRCDGTTALHSVLWPHTT
jgi:hypothetical protein